MYQLTLIYSAGTPINGPGKGLSRDFRHPMCMMEPANKYFGEMEQFYGKKRQHAAVGLPRTDEYRNQKRRLDTLLGQFCLHPVHDPAILVSERLVVAGHDDPDHPVVLAVIAVGRQTLDMGLSDTTTRRRMSTT